MPLPPVAPTNLLAAPLSGSQITVTWTDTANDETGFAIERAPDAGGTPGAFGQIATVSSNVTAYISGGLTTNTTYWYRVRASNAGGYSPYSNLANAMTFASSFDSWINPSSWKWETGCGVVCPWSLGVPPSVNVSGVLITNVGSKTVTIDATTVSNSPSTMTISNLTVSAPSGATNTLLLSTAGSTNPLHVVQAISLGSGGLLDVENSSMQVDSLSKAGSAIDGTFLFQNGGQVTFSGRELQGGAGQLIVGNVATGQMLASSGTVTTYAIDVGYAAGSQGTLTVAGIAAVRCSLLSIGQSTNSTGSVWVTGGQMTTTNGGQPNVLYVGYGGAGQMTVSNGTLLSARITVGALANSRGTLTVAGGSVTVSSLLNIGSLSTAVGSVWVKGGQLVATNGTTTIGGPSDTGQMTASGGSVESLSMIVGQSAGSQGSLTVSGGTVTVWSSLVVGDCATTASGRVTVVSGGTLFVTNASHTAFLDVRNGTLVVSNGGVLVADRIVATNSCGRIVRSSGGTITASTLILDPSLSAVGDGLPNGWKQQYGFDPFDPTVARADPDGDGLSNLQEFLAGTDPTNSSSALRITAITRVGADIRVYFTSVGGKYYSLQRCDSMGGAWTDIVTNIPGSAGVQWVKDIGGATRASAYYRIELSQLSNPPPADSDSDGIPDGWTQKYFGHPTGQAFDHSLATDDADGDGMSNLQEYLAGTDPTNGASAFRITSVLRTNSDVLITWMMGSGKTNALQVTTGDAGGGYSTNSFTDIFIVTNTVGTVTNYLDGGAASNAPARYYRVRLLP